MALSTPKQLDLDLFPFISRLEPADVSQHTGQTIYKEFPMLRDIATVMEHPEFYRFYQTYLNPSDERKRQQTLVLLRVYDWISQHLPERYNAYHKLFVLYSLLNHPKYSRVLYEKMVLRLE
jgi:hypothetical protein